MATLLELLETEAPLPQPYVYHSDNKSIIITQPSFIKATTHVNTKAGHIKCLRTPTLEWIHVEFYVPGGAGNRIFQTFSVTNHDWPVGVVAMVKEYSQRLYIATE